MTANAGREHRIINALLVVCVIAGFACFVFFALPDHLKKAGAFPEKGPSGSPAKLASIVELGEKTFSHAPASKAANAGGDLLTSPETTPAANPIGDAGQAPDDNMVAGGAGVAIDDESSESSQALAYDAAPAAATGADAVDPIAEGVKSDMAAMASSGTPVETKTHAVSSLAQPGRSAQMAGKTAGGRSWLATPAGLEADVAFWHDIYAKYDKNTVVLHHPRYLGVAYAVMNFSEIENDPRLNDIERARIRENRVKAKCAEYTGILKKLADGAGDSSLGPEEKRVKALFDGITEPDRFRRAAEEDGVRSQTGQREKFAAGLTHSGRYLGEIEGIFDAYGVPREITRLIFVESMFNLQAVSKTGASGIWQFMPGTGKLYLQMNDIIDERNDPIAATHAAAKLLRHNYERLGTWPLAINAYNAGRGRLEQAVARLGTTDIGTIIKNFSHPGYGFASRNFFLEFLAALDVAENADKYFGSVQHDPPLRYDVVSTNFTISLPEVVRVSGISPSDVLELNPAFSRRVSTGVRPLPAGFRLRVPAGKGKLFLAAAARAPSSRTGPLKHQVARDETLQGIARMYGVEPKSIVEANKGMGWRVKIGQTILVPVDGVR